MNESAVMEIGNAPLILSPSQKECFWDCRKHSNTEKNKKIKIKTGRKGRDMCGQVGIKNLELHVLPT